MRDEETDSERGRDADRVKEEREMKMTFTAPRAPLKGAYSVNKHSFMHFVGVRAHPPARPTDNNTKHDNKQQTQLVHAHSSL